MGAKLPLGFVRQEEQRGQLWHLVFASAKKTLPSNWLLWTAIDSDLFSWNRFLENNAQNRPQLGNHGAKGESWLWRGALAVGATGKVILPYEAVALAHCLCCFMNKTGTERVSSNLELYLPLAWLCCRRHVKLNALLSWWEPGMVTSPFWVSSSTSEK